MSGLRRVLAIALVGLAALAAGCASLAPPVEAWLLAASGRLSVRVDPVEPGGAPRASSAVFELLGQASAGELRLSSPLGTVLAVARWQPGEVWLRAEGETREYPDLDSLTRDMIGEPLPVAALFDWLRARPWPQAEAEPLPDGQPGFVQLGWAVELARAGEGLIVARRQALPVVTVRARLDPA